MSVVFPTTLDDTSTFPVAATLTTETLSDEPHSRLHGDIGEALLALETKVGINSSADTSSLDYKINHLGGVPVPTGTVLPYAGATAPTGFLLCYGQLVSTTTYATLFGIIGSVFGSGSGTFGIPDMRGRVPAGLDNIGGSAASRIASATAMGASGGESAHALITAELAAHNHTVTVTLTSISGTVSGTTSADGAHLHNVNNDVISYTAGGGLGPFANIFDTGYLNGGTKPTDISATHTHTFSGSFTGTPSGSASSGSTGSGTAHNNLQPYVGLNYIIAI